METGHVAPTGLFLIFQSCTINMPLLSELKLPQFRNSCKPLNSITVPRPSAAASLFPPFFRDRPSVCSFAFSEREGRWAEAL
jgi:hypothetical protein